MTTSALNSDNIKSHLARVYIDERKTKDGKPYYMKIEFWNMPNGELYKLEEFLTSEKLTLLKMSVPIQQAL